MIIQDNYSLKELNTFHFDVKSDFFCTPKNEEEIIEALSNPLVKDIPLLVLGGGSNVLFKTDFKGLILKPNIQTVQIIEESNSHVIVECGAGVDWDYFVEWSVNQGYYGIENLSLIPGNVGASPVQNIGAYGVEVKDVILQVNGIFLDTLEPFSFKNEECQFDYRNSIFKNTLKDKTIITSVTFELQKQGELKADYGNIKEELQKYDEINLSTIRKAIIAIRESKLPDHQVFGNCGSFFKNPVVENDIANRILDQYPNAPHYKVGDSYTKIPAGWLIEQCNWKGKGTENAQVHQQQALVIINKTGRATGKEVLLLAEMIQHSVMEKFNIQIEKEVNVI